MLRASLALAAACAGCAAAVPPSTPAPARTVTLGLGERGAFGGLAVTPLRVEEDSRCPAQVQCIQAGTVRLGVRVEARRLRRQAVLTLHQPLEIDAGARLTLCAVTPRRERPGPIRPARYRFTLALDRSLAVPAPACGG